MTRLHPSKNEVLTFIKWFLLASLALIISGVINGAFEEGLILLVLIGPIIEELAKTAVILLDRKKGPKRTTKIGLIVGLGFGIFEAILSDPSEILGRLSSTIPGHMSLGGIDGFAVGSKRYWMIAGAIGLHSLLNAVSNSGICFAQSINIFLAFLLLFIIYSYLKTASGGLGMQ
jgi:hypothetical protein